MAFVELPQNVIVFMYFSFRTSVDLGLAVNKLFY